MPATLCDFSNEKKIYHILKELYLGISAAHLKKIQFTLNVQIRNFKKSAQRFFILRYKRR